MGGTEAKGPEAGGTVRERMMAHVYVRMESKGILAGEEVILREVTNGAALEELGDIPWAKSGVPLPEGGVWKPSPYEARMVWAIMYGVEIPGEGELSLGEAIKIVRTIDPKGARRVSGEIMKFTFGDDEEIADLKNDGNPAKEEDGPSSSESAV